MRTQKKYLGNKNNNKQKMESHTAYRLEMNGGKI